MKYLIDTSSIFDLRDYYPPDIFPSIWELIFDMFDDGTMFSVQEVFNELKDFQEPWEKYNDSFIELPESKFENLEYIMSDEKFEVFQRQGLKKSNEENWADPYLIACAMGDEDISILTEESVENKALSKIPYVCSEVGVNCVNLLAFMKERGLRF
ncbi:MAG: DUF4411 family protein [Methanobrevibacter sp.]|uniref:DUF4411 family protein n=1 Tax=Methanobrevibacter sp. TaxID=66852 RepID=UPI0026E05807|nr:DUF4411 family protein [Methanobrevibacter sp.]MDO5849266.1 DUF4411 family protein [Methanobrevibacter sp.]